MADDPIEAAKRRTMTGQSNFPAVNKFTRPNYRPFSSGAKVNTLDMNIQSPSQLGIGQIGLGAIGTALSRRTNPADQLFAPAQSTSQDTLFPAAGQTLRNMLQNTPSGYSTVNAPGGGYLYQPQAQPKTQYTLPGINAAPNALSDPSVGALESATRTTNQFGQQVINPSGGGQIITGKGPSTPLQTTFQYTNPNGQNVRGLPGGGQAITASRKPGDKQTPMQPPNGQTWLGGWIY